MNRRWLRRGIAVTALTREGGVTGEDLFTRPLAPGKHHIVFDFKYDGPGMAKGGTGALSVDGHELSNRTIEHTIPLLMSIDETFDVGADTRTPVDDSYDVPFRFTGAIDKLTISCLCRSRNRTNRRSMRA
jgi:hypothetical protein